MKLTKNQRDVLNGIIFVYDKDNNVWHSYQNIDDYKIGKDIARFYVDNIERCIYDTYDYLARGIVGKG